MCPACITSAALTAGGVITTGGLTALVGKIVYTAKSVKTDALSSRRSSVFRRQPSKAAERPFRELRNRWETDKT